MQVCNDTDCSKLAFSYSKRNDDEGQVEVCAKLLAVKSMPSPKQCIEVQGRTRPFGHEFRARLQYFKYNPTFFLIMSYVFHINDLP